MVLLSTVVGNLNNHILKVTWYVLVKLKKSIHLLVDSNSAQGNFPTFA
jgi:hypothetical protein